jgi:hypothetical protein
MVQTFSDLLKILEAHETRPYTFDRIPRKAQSVYGRPGNEILKAATAVAERGHVAVREHQKEFSEISDPVERRKARLAISKHIKPIEADLLLKWAKKTGVLLDNDEFDRRWEQDGRKGETENELYYDEASHRWFKRNNMFMHVNYLEFLHRMALHNYLFPEAPVKLEGFVLNQDVLMPVMSQPHVRAERGATKQEVIKYMQKLGFKHKTGVDFYNPDTGVIVEDLHDENVLVDPENPDHMYIVDPIIFLDDQGKTRRLAAYSDLEELNSV